MNAFLEQLKRLWSELGLNQKVSLSIATLAVVAAMGGLLMWSSNPSMTLLYGRVDPKEMGDVVEVLEENGIPYRLEQGGTSIFAPKDQIGRMRMQMASRGVPSGGGVGFEIFDRTNFGISDFIQKTNYMRAIQGELARTISQMQGIRSARVMVVMPESRLLVNNEKGRATASVFIETTHRLEREGVNAIRFLVANSVDGLLVDDVAVVDQKGHMLTADKKDDPLMGLASGQFRFRQGMETYLAQKIETMLGKIVGPQNIVARVAVDLETESVTKRSQLFDPEGQVVRSQTHTEDSHATSESRAATGAPAGVGANAPQGAVAGASPTSSTQDSRKNRTIAYEINQSTTESVKGPGDIKKVTAAVFIAMKMSEDGKPMARSADEINRMKQMVANAIGTNVQSDVSAITVEEVPFENTDKSALLPPLTLTDQVSTWVNALSGIAPLGIGFVLVLVFLRMLKKAKTKEVSIEFIEEAPAQAASKRRKPAVTADMLNALIQEEPESVSSTLKSWALAENKTS